MINDTLGNVFYLHAKRRARQVRKNYSDPAGLQARNLRRIIRRTKKTAFGRKFSFNKIRSVKDYQKAVPLFSYEKMKPWIDRCLEGKPDQIWPGKIEYFALTSGTTLGSSKYIPVSEEVIGQNKQAVLDSALFYFANTKDKSLFDGKMLFLGGSTSLEPLPNGLWAGDMSGILSRFIPFYISGCQEPRSDLIELPDWEEKIKRIAEDVKDKDVRMICGLPSWLLVFFDHLLKLKEKDRVCDVWPNLSLFIYGGMDFSPYAKVMRDTIGKDIYYQETYFSSEAFIGVQDLPRWATEDDNGILLVLDRGVFYEFIKEEDLMKDDPERHTVPDVETDINYAIAVTNVNGLYSYLIGDMVKFTSKEPLRIKVTGRTKSFLSVVGEHMIAEEIDYAITQAISGAGGMVTNYTVAPYHPATKEARPGHQWLIEFQETPKDINKFMNIIDKALCEKNDDYALHRKKDFGMTAPSVCVLKEGVFYRWHKEKGQLGGQHKTPHLRNNRTIAEELLRLNGQA